MDKITDPKLKMFIEFFKTQGVRFVDADTGKEIYTDEETEKDRADVLDTSNSGSDNDGNSGENIIRVVRR